MVKIRQIYSLRELLDLLRSHIHLKEILLILDLDLTIIEEADDDNDKLIEPEVTKELFKFLLENDVNFCFLTARYHDTVCNMKKRDLERMTNNIRNTLFPIFKELGIDVSDFNGDKDELVPIKTEKGRCVGIIYRGILFGSSKGRIIKEYRRMTGADKFYPYTIFVDDIKEYLQQAMKFVPGITVLQRQIV